MATLALAGILGVIGSGASPANSAGVLPTGPWWGYGMAVYTYDPVVRYNATMYGGVTTTADDTVVTGGYFRDTLSLPKSDGSSIRLTSQGSYDGFVAGMAADDTGFTWATAIGGTGYQSVKSIKSLSSGAIVIGGDFDGTTTFPTGLPAPNDSITLASRGNRDAFMAALRPGTPYFAWAVHAGGSANDRIDDIATSGDDSIAVTGYVDGTSYFPISADDSVSIAQGFFAAEVRASSGYFSWVRGWNPTSGSSAQIAYQRHGALVVGQNFTGSATLPGQGANISVTAPSGSPALIAHIDAGAYYFDWAVQATGASVDVGDLAVTSDDTIIIGGSHYEPATFPTSAATSITLPSVFRRYGYVAALDPSTRYFLWAQPIAGQGSEFARYVAVTRDDTVIVSGTADISGNAGVTFPTGPGTQITLTSVLGNWSNDVFVAGLNPATSYFTWAQEAGGLGNDQISGTALLASGAPVVVGETNEFTTQGLRITPTASFPTSADDSFTVTGQFLSVLGTWPARVRPGAPRNPSATAGNASATVSWQAPLSPGTSPITSYEVSSTPPGGTCTVNALSCTVQGLSNGTAYAFSVRAVSLAGASDWSVTSNTVAPFAPPPPPQPSPPGPPNLLTATPGNSQVTLTWARPDWEGSTPVSGYRVYAAPGGQVCTVSTTACTVTDLTNGQTHEFWVTALNSIGESSPSRRLTATPRPDPPGAPDFLSATPSNAQALLAWDPPASDGGSPITGYRVYTGTGTLACTSIDDTCLVTGLTNGRSYEFWVTAVNSAGESPPSRRLSVTPALALPGPPIDVAGTAGDKRIHWAWKPPESEGSYPVERYQVILNPLLPTVGGIACTVAAPETSCTVPKLTPGTTYTARVRAWSTAGWGPWSASSAGVKVPLPPQPGIAVEVRRLPKDPDEVKVKGRTQGIKAGTALYVWIHRETEYGYLESFQGTSRPVVDEDGDFTWERTAPKGRIWEVIWCTQPNVKGTCSRWTLL